MCVGLLQQRQLTDSRVFSGRGVDQNSLLTPSPVLLLPACHDPPDAERSEHSISSSVG
jgi:hypothetical protein